MKLIRPVYVVGDSFDLLARWRWRKPRLIATSVPYWGLRGYAAGERGWGHSGEPLHEWIEKAGRFARFAHLVADDDAWAAINVGDSRTGSGGAGGDYAAGGGYAGRARYRQGPASLRYREADGNLAEFELAKQQLALAPFRLADEWQRAGWSVVSQIVWVKPGPKPESAAHVKRPRMQHETIWLFRKGRPAYHVDRELYRSDVWRVGRARLPRVEPKPKAPWPPALVEGLILPLTEEGDLVLDPFAGSGVTGIVAGAHGRRSVLLDADDDAASTYAALIAAGFGGDWSTARTADVDP